MQEMRSHDDIIVFKVVTDEIQIKLLSLRVNKNLFYLKWLQLTPPPRLPTSDHLVLLQHLTLSGCSMLLLLERTCSDVLMWRTCWSLTTESSLLLLHFVPVLFFYLCFMEQLRLQMLY